MTSETHENWLLAYPNTDSIVIERYSHEFSEFS